MNLRARVRVVRAFVKRAGTISESSHSILLLLNTTGIVAAMLLGGAVSTAFAAASLTPLGIYNHANGVSADGSGVVGTSGGYGGQAFRWTAAGGMVGLGRPPGDFYSYARGVNGDGSVVVGGSDYEESIDEYTVYYRTQAFRWTAGAGMQSLGHLPGGGLQSVAIGVSADGSVVVGSSDSASGYRAFRWTAAGGMQGLGDLPGGWYQTEANSVSGDGSVVVGYGASAFNSEAFRWTSAGGMVGLGILPGDLNSSALGVSADGSVVVGNSASGCTGGCVGQAFRWTSGDGMVGLGILPGAINSYAYGVSGDGSVVVGYGDGDFGTEAFLWTSDGGMRALWDVLLSHGVDPAVDGWSRLEFANAISADGNTIVGNGIRNNNTEAFVAVIPTIVPEPAAGALTLLGVSSILLLRRRFLWRPNKFSAVLMLAIALAPGAASAQEDDTLTISGTFNRAGPSGIVGPDLAEIFANGDDYTWTLTLHGTTHSHYYDLSLDTLWEFFDTDIHATSFDLEFFGPDAATLNGIVSEHIAGGTARISLSNIHTNGDGDDFALMDLRVSGPDMALYAQQHFWWENPLVPADADGYPVVVPEPFSIRADYTDLVDWRPGNDGRIIPSPSQAIVTFEGSVGGLPGDYNHDGLVDAADYTVWRDGLGSTYTMADYDTWKSRFGQSLGAGSGAAGYALRDSAASHSPAVPEPSTLVLAIMTMAASLLVKRSPAPARWPNSALEFGRQT